MPRNELPPDTLLAGKIRLIKRIGRGGMGDVWLARNEATEAEVAVKTLHRAERTPEHDERFRREARLSATISHRNVVRVFDLVDEPGGTLGLVMELLRGATLEELMKQRGPLSTLHAVAVAVPVLSAMHYVHQKGIVHRDVKPANVFVAVEPDGHVLVKVLDFGIAKLPSAGSALTMDDSVLGTPHYMSPEQIRGRDDIDGRSDMFSFAVVLYEMLTGDRVFRRDLPAASLAAVLEHQIAPDPRLPPRLWAALSRALSKDPDDRHASCAELGDALRAAIDATDEDLAQALQELHPRTEEPRLTTTSLSSIGLSMGAPRRPKRRFASSWGLKVAGVGAIAAAAFVVGIKVTRPSEVPRGAEAGAAPEASAPPAARHAAAPASPIEPAPMAPLEPSSPAADKDRSNGEIPPDPTSPEAEADRPLAEAAPPATARAPVPESAPPTEKKRPASTRPRSGGVATTPGF